MSFVTRLRQWKQRAIVFLNEFLFKLTRGQREEITLSFDKLQMFIELIKKDFRKPRISLAILTEQILKLLQIALSTLINEVIASI